LYSIEKKESIHLGNQNRWIRGPGADGTLHWGRPCQFLIYLTSATPWRSTQI
jgi:hypothetical protein